MATETLDRGLVTSREPALLQSGELQRATNVIYRGGSPALWRVPGRTRFNSSAEASAILGVRYLNFDASEAGTVSPIIVAMVGTTYRSGTFTALTGTFANLATSVGTATTLDSVYYNNRHYLLNGNSSGVANRVIFPAPQTGILSSRRQGLQPVTGNVSLAAGTGAGWPTGAEFGDGYYFFFVTEVDKTTDVFEIEGTYIGQPPPSIQITGTADGVALTLPAAAINSSATHFRIYMVGPKERNEWTDLFFVDATKIMDIDVAQANTTITIGGGTASTQTQRATDNDASTWTNPTNALTENNTDATGAEGQELILKSFAFTTGSIGTIRGIEVMPKMRFVSSTVVTLKVEISRDSGATWGNPRFISIYKGIPLGSLLQGGGQYFVGKTGTPTDLWGRAAGTFVAADFTVPGVFRVRFTVAAEPGTGNPDRIGIDFAQVRLYYSTSYELKRQENFPAVVTTIGPVTAVVPANGPPPIASTGAIYQGQMVLNDVSNGSLIRYSLPDGVEYFPSIYALNTNNPDPVTCLKTVHSLLLAGTRHALIRVNYLPLGEDPQFNAGRAMEYIDRFNGIAGPLAATTFTTPGQPELLAYASYTGLRYTNGTTTDTLTEDIDWPNTVNLSKLHLCHLINYPALFTMVFHYIPADDTTSTVPTRELWLNYHPSKVKANGKLSVVGPIERGSLCSALAYINNVPIMITGNADGRVYIEDQGITQESGETLNPDIILRDIYPAGVGNEARIENVYLRYGFNDPGLLLEIIPYVKSLEEDYLEWKGYPGWAPELFRTSMGRAVPGGQSSLVNAGGYKRVAPDFNAESFTLRIRGTDVPNEPAGAMALSFLEYTGTPTNQGV